MLTLGPIGFAAPLLLAALLLLPVLWWLLRVTPPAPQRQPFPAVRLLRDLIAPEETPHRTPLWLLLLRVAAAALLILGLARPVWNPQAVTAAEGPLLIVVDDGWASAPDWANRTAAAAAALDQAGREGRRVALLATAPDADANPPRATGLMPAEDARARLAALRPKPWAPDRAAALEALAAFRQANPGPLETLWIADPAEHDPEAAPAARFAAALSEAGPLTLLRAERPARLLLPPEAAGDRLRVRVAQTPAPVPTEAAVLARTGDGRVLARATIAIPPGAAEASADLDLPTEIRNRVLSLDLDGEAGAGAVVLLDERFRRRPVGLVTDVAAETETPLLGAFWFVDRALSPTAELRRGGVETLLARPLAVMILADRPVSGAEETLLARFVEQGGMLIRFAGPRTAERSDALLPVPLRGGERALGGALSWDRPQRLAPFTDASPFAGLPVPEEVTVSRQVLAEPGPALAARSWARLADGTPLVTAEARGAGRIVLFHVTAEATWSDLPLSGLFVEMLRRLVALSAGVQGAEDGSTLPPLEALDGFGVLGAPGPAAQPVPANAIAAARPGPRSPPGWYGLPGEGAERRALNAGAGLPAPAALPAPPPGTRLASLGEDGSERDLMPWLLAAALLLLAADLLASLWLRGGLRVPRLGAAALVLALALPAAAQPLPEGAAALETRLAYVVTGDPETDRISRMGLVGLSDFVNRRTAAALADPVGVVPGRDDLSFFPLLYWPILPQAQANTPEAVVALNQFMANGGIILFDTRAEGSGDGFAPGARQALRRVTQGLTIPPLQPVPEEHVITRAFYLLNELPGRFAGGQVWVSAEEDRANDSVSPVVIGGHDWAAAWAVDERGQNPFATIPGGARQRILAYRFGVNLVMYALTGNYKGDQVHAPAILERMGN
ncbi:MAG: DUF4159 domain-containing protein [Acetobacteraceae bacterium]